tara:strand:- start:453 stop:689 length:237 start_codon:yes stop_codon:yes gene_type:complete
VAKIDDYESLKIGSLVRWWGNYPHHSENEQDIDDIGIVIRETDHGLSIWWSATVTENTFDWEEIENSIWEDKLEIIRA